MTAGRGIVHSELSPEDKPPTMHGLQLWLALPESDRFTAPTFVSHRELPELAGDGVAGIVLLGAVGEVRSPAHTYTALLAVDLELQPGAEVTLPLRPGHEHGVFVITGTVEVAGRGVDHDQLLYLGTGRDTLTLRSEAGGRVLLLGGEPFAEELVMWWNFVGRSHDEVAGYRREWLDRADRFPPVVDRSERVMEAPEMPTVRLRPRPRRSPDDRKDP